MEKLEDRKEILRQEEGEEQGKGRSHKGRITSVGKRKERYRRKREVRKEKRGMQSEKNRKKLHL